MEFNKKIINYIKDISLYGKTAMNIITNPDKNDKQILDPLTTVIKIALLYFYDNGTKISIKENSIKLQKFDGFQGIIRWIYGDSRDKLYNLKEPIQNCLMWFPFSKYQDLKLIYSYAIKGLEKLKRSYTIDSGNITIHLIEYYIKIINDNLNKKEINLNMNLEESIVLNDNLQKSIKEIWTLKDIKLINDFFEILINRENEKKDYENIFLSILEFLKEKDIKVKNYIIKYSTELII